MNLQIVGCSHQECPLELREMLAVGQQQLPGMLEQFRTAFPSVEAVLLSTCNRTEIYTAADTFSMLPSREDIAEFLARTQGIESGAVSAKMFRHIGSDAVRHLFRVAASLDSMVVGEAQILSQVKQAYLVASQEHSTGVWTHAAFQSAIAVAKRVATETSIHARRVSIPSVAIGEFAKQIFERFDDKSILVIGAGEMSQESLRYLVSEGAKQINIVNRHFKRALDLAKLCGGQTHAWSELDELLVQADLVVSTTGSQEPIVSLERFQALEQRRFQRPLFIVDLAVPRDFDPRIGDCLGVYLYSIDDLKQACEWNRSAREKELPKARQIVEEEALRFMSQTAHQTTGPTIRQLKESAEAISQAELERLFRKLDRLDSRSRAEIEQSFQRLVNKILHPPLESLREQSGHREHAHLLEALRRLFRLME